MSYKIEKIYNEQNVFEAACERCDYILDHFDNICLSFSGGKDSGVMVQLMAERAKLKNRTFDILYIDLEGMYKSTRRYVNEIRKLPQIDNFYWFCMPIKLRNGTSMMQTEWVCWDFDFVEEGGHFIRPLPKESINWKNYKDVNIDMSWFKWGMQFEDFVPKFQNAHAKMRGGKVAVGVGIRCDESLNRFRALTYHKKNNWEGFNWTTDTQDKDNQIINFYPIYDWSVKDIWTATFKRGWLYNEFYEAMYKAGVPISQVRICQPFGDDQKQGLDQFKFYEPETWAKVLLRVKGANFGNIYARTEAIGNGRITKPEGHTWESYTIFLLETLMDKNPDLSWHYINKMRDWEKWYIRHFNATVDNMADDITPGQRESEGIDYKYNMHWRRICKMILRNDYYGHGLSLSQTIRDNEELDKIIKKWESQI